MQNKKGFTLIELMIVVAIVAILAMIAVPMYQKYIERSRNTAAQNMLQQIGLSEVASQTEAAAAGITANYITVKAVGDDANVTQLMTFGFRPDPNVGFYVDQPGTQPGFVAFACHRAVGSQMYVYDNITGGGVKPVTTGAVYATIPQPASLPIFTLKTGVTEATLNGPATVSVPVVNGKSTGI